MGQVAFVTGSSRGIGRAVALALAARGFDVAVNGRAASDALERTVADVRAIGVSAIAISGDVGELAAHQAMLDQAEAALGPLTTLINNAGVGPLQRADLLETSEASYDHCLLLNAKAVYFLMQAFARRLLSRSREPGLHYSVVTISSISAEAASINRGDYCVSKAAAAMATKAFAARLAPEGIQVFDVQPGIIETDMSAPAMANYRRRIEQEGLTLIKRAGQPDDVARVVASAVSGGLPYMAGQVLRVDGGLGMLRL